MNKMEGHFCKKKNCVTYLKEFQPEDKSNRIKTKKNKTKTKSSWMTCI